MASNIHQALLPGELEGADAPSLWSMGLSSVTAVQLVTSLSDRLHVPLPPTLVFDHPTAEAVVRYVEARNPPGLTIASSAKAGGTVRIGDKHLAEVEATNQVRFCMNIHPEGKSC